MRKYKIKNTPMVSLMWDGDYGSINAENYEIEWENGIYSYCDLYVDIEGKTYWGDHWTPSSFEIKSETIEVGEIVVLNEDGNEVELTLEEEKHIEKQIKENLEWS